MRATLKNALFSGTGHKKAAAFEKKWSWGCPVSLPAESNRQGRRLEDILEIFIITYNRAGSLKSTLQAILSEVSPVRGVSIVILDNASTDGTKLICGDFARRYGNVRHIRHRRNIGGGGNICRAFESASKEYIWVLADDDSYDWSNWPHIEQAMFAGYDAVFTTLVNLCRVIGPGAAIYECGFLPGCIYRAEWLDDDVIQGMYNNITTFQPHITLSLAMLKNGGRFFIPYSPVVKQAFKFESLPQISSADYTKGVRVNHSPYVKDKFWEIGMLTLLSETASSSELCHLHEKIFNDIFSLYGGVDAYLNFMIDKYLYHNLSRRNLMEIYTALPKNAKKSFMAKIFLIFNSRQSSSMPVADDWNIILASELSAVALKNKIARKRLHKMHRSVYSKIISEIKKKLAQALVKFLNHIIRPDW